MRAPITYLGLAFITIFTSTTGCQTSSGSAETSPHVSFYAMPTELLGKSFAISIEVLGCSAISKAWVTNQEKILAQTDNINSQVIRLSVPQEKIPFNRWGIAADLGLRAHATCSNGQTGSSNETIFSFTPLHDVLTGPWNLGSNFWVEEDGATVLVCDGKLIRQGKENKPSKEISLRFNCDSNSILIFAENNGRFLFQAREGVAYFDRYMENSYSWIFDSGIPPSQIAITNSGNGFAAFIQSEEGWRIEQYLLKPYSPKPFWKSDLYPMSTIAGKIAANADNQIIVPHKTPLDFGGGYQVLLEIFSSDGANQKRPILTVSTDEETPTIFFDSTGETAYLAHPTGSSSTVRACPLNSDFICENGWTSPPLDTPISEISISSQKLVVWGEQKAYFLRSSDGAILGSPVIPASGLVFTAVVFGADGSTYLLAQQTNYIEYYGENYKQLLPGIRQILIYDDSFDLVANIKNQKGFLVDIDPTGRGWLYSSDIFLLPMPSEMKRMIAH